MTAKPDVVIVERGAADELVLLACDGLWDVFTNQEAVENVRTLFREGEHDVALVAEEMLDLALEKGLEIILCCFFC